ncbi:MULTISPECIES: rhomboid family intramembrane serine protease [Brevibacterium]|uniref:rhomboid family intramembrane serine protease n=1 Tax=Brevibacterium TaxID=1696 RepID=UPI00227E3AF9|nr:MULTISPECIES: rhomboid family intramembrane serine protease [Brevibacterium]WAL39652.1 rhomboid family intramembrane serine protease [Brevibacterium sp. BRM-1]
MTHDPGAHGAPEPGARPSHGEAGAGFGPSERAPRPAPAPAHAPARPAAGGRRPRRPSATATIIAVTLACFVLQFIPGLHLQQALAFSPALAESQPWRALTAALVHAQPNPGHVFFNMVGLFFFGTFVERSVGSRFLVAVYVLAAFGGSLLTLLLSSPSAANWHAGYVGASGAVFGIVGVLLTPTRRLDRNISGVVLFVVLNVGYMAIEPTIAWQAHLGGLLVGFVLGCLRLLPPRRLGPPVFWVGAGALAVVMGALYALA